MAPQKPDPTEPRNWFQRQLQRWRPKPDGDTIVTQIGDGAQNNAVGKNIIQIGAIQVSRSAIVVIIIGVLTLVSIAIKNAIDNQQTAQSSQQIALKINATATPTATSSPTPTLFPPASKEETLVVVADFLDPTNVDVRDVTADLVEQMRKTLASYPHIRVERLRRPIPRDNGSATAMQIGEDPAISATLVIWGQYVSPPDPELTVHFDIVRQFSTYLPTTSTDRFGPANIQPSMFDFKVNLGNELGQLVAFATGVTLFNTRQYKAAEPLFTIASQVISHTVAADFAQAMHYYRGLNYLHLGRFREAQPDLMAALPNTLPADLQANELYPALLNSVGAVYSGLGEKQRALDYYNQALPFRHRVGDKAREATILINIGLIYDDLGEKQKALSFYNQALLLAQQVGDKADEAATLNNIGGVYSALGQQQKALDFFNRVLPLRHQVGDKAGEARTLNNIGSVYSDLGQKQKALDYYNQALLLRHQVGDKAGEARTLNNIGGVYSDLGQKQKALDFFNQTLPLAQQAGDKAGEATILNNIGFVYNALGEKPKALDFFNQALTLIRQVGDKAREATILNNVGGVYSDLGQKQKALDFFNQTLLLTQQVGDRWGESTTRYNIAIVYIALGDLAHAEEQLTLAVVLDKTLGIPDLADHRKALERVQTARQQAREEKK